MSAHLASAHKGFVCAHWLDAQDRAPVPSAHLSILPLCCLLPPSLAGVNVLFQLHKPCKFGEAWAVCGNVPELGAWDPKRALPLRWSKGDTWTAQIPLPRDITVQWRFVLIDANTKALKMWLTDGT